MSHDLYTRFNSFPQWGAILGSSTDYLRDLLLLDSVPHFKIKGLNRGNEISVNRNSHIREDLGFLVSNEAEKAEVYIVVFNAFEGEELIKSIAVTPSRTATSYALATAIALSLSDVMDSKITDDALKWTTYQETTKDELFSLLRLHTPQIDFQVAAKKFYGNLNGS